jgi:hypothetical protein
MATFCCVAQKAASAALLQADQAKKLLLEHAQHVFSIF